MKRKVNNHYEIDLIVKENPYNLEEDILFEMATRNNEKRRFLFVSKVIGKHMSVKPSNSLALTRLLAMHYYEKSTGCLAVDHAQVVGAAKALDTHYDSNSFEGYEVADKSLVIGFAETATALGHGIFESLSNPMGYYHTTREVLAHDGDVIAFEEEHSHATSHKIYQSHKMRLSDAEKVILVDDEISTGNTLINIMQSIKENFGVKTFDIVTILDWRNEENKLKFEKFAQSNDIKVEVYSLLQGEINEVSACELDLDEIKSNPLFLDIKNDHTEDLYEEAKRVHINLLEDADNVSPDKNHTYSKLTGRFGLDGPMQRELIKNLSNSAQALQGYVSGKTLVLGTEEFMYVPLRLAANLKGDVHYKSLTRSPIYPDQRGSYPIRSGLKFKSLYNPSVDNYVYNLKEEAFDTILVMIEKINSRIDDSQLYNLLRTMCPKVRMIYLGDRLDKGLNYPPIIGSYKEEDVVFLLKEIGEGLEEQDNYSREKAIQSGVHYSEMLPIEYKPTDEYLDIFYKSLETDAKKLALSVGVIAEKLLKLRGPQMVLVSLARAGTPAGVLLKRYYRLIHNLEIPHYSISIIRGRGIDENAIQFILERHPDALLQFIDGWTGKGAITHELREAVKTYRDKHGVGQHLNDQLAVIADPGHCVQLYGTREDFLIPNACLNSTISGLLSRTVYNTKYIGKEDYHGVKYYRELAEDDLSNFYIEKIEKYFLQISHDAQSQVSSNDLCDNSPQWLGMKDVEQIQSDFDIDNVHFVKPGIGETTRVLLRRMPWKILIREDSKNLEHVLKLAHEKGIPVEKYPLASYHCCGIVKNLKGE